VGSTEVQFHASYSWTCRNSEGLTQEGSEYRTTAFSPDTRRYTTKTDLDEYDKSLPSRFSVWLWISPDVKMGDKVSILDDEFAVTGESV
jgi:hypothetical protein